MTVKMMICGRRRPGQTLKAHRFHMKDLHGRLVLDYIAAEPEHAPRRYVQNHAFDCVFAPGDPSANPFGLGFDFVTELWFPDLAAAKSSRETPYYLERLKPDEPQMVDDARVLGGAYEENRIKVPSSDHEAIKLFVIMEKSSIVPLEAVEATYADLPDISGHSRNVALVPGPIGVIDEFWLPHENAAYTLADAYRDTAARFVGADYEQASVALVIAKEFVLYPGH